MYLKSVSQGNKMHENKKKLDISILANAQFSFLILMITNGKSIISWIFSMICHHFVESYWLWHLCPGETNYGKDSKSLFLVFHLSNQWLIRHKVKQLYNSEKKIQHFRLVQIWLFPSRGPRHSRIKKIPQDNWNCKCGLMKMCCSN